jgi:diacylglycerol O-acyltransferase / wax synthase
VGNLVSPMLVDVPTIGAVSERLAQVEAAVRAHRQEATGPPPIAILGGLSGWSQGLAAIATT